MSSVRMCDRCGTVFSELADGWQAFSASTMRKDPDTGRRESVAVMMDACPTCAIIPDDSPAVRRDDDAFFARKELEQRVGELEDELRQRDAAPEPAAEAEAVVEPPATA